MSGIAGKNCLKVLVFVTRYLPSHRAGGPLRTIANMVQHFGDDFRFRIVTGDRDSVDAEAFEDVEVGNWNRVGKAMVMYCSPEQRTLRGVARIIRHTPHDVLYLNSFFNRVFSIYPLLSTQLGLVPKRRVIVAPRGEFSQGALGLKWCKKQGYLRFAKLVGLYRDVFWQASSQYEAADIRRVMASESRGILIAPNISAPAAEELTHIQCNGSAELRVVFLSRITPIKNLEHALCVLGQVNVPVAFDIYGPVSDGLYWRRCQRLLEKLPANVRVRYRGAIEHEAVGRTMANADLFFLPTRGENYGHVIAEALSAGTPVLISDKTPWRGLEQAGVGWDLPLADKRAFVEAIEKTAHTNEDGRRLWRQRVRDYARQRLTASDVFEANRQLFYQAVERTSLRATAATYNHEKGRAVTS